MSDEREVSLAMVLTQGEVELDAEAWGRVLDGLDLPIVGRPTSRGEALSVELEGGGLLAVGLVPMPLDEAQVQTHRVPNALWPDAAATLGNHDGHVLVSVIGGDGLAGRMALTVAAVATATWLDALGVLWVDVPHVTRTDIARSTLGGAQSSGDLPVPLWISVQLARTAEGRLSAVTQGLQTFGHDDLHITSAKMGPQEIWGQAMSIAEYVISSGAALQAGQTLGSSDDERLPIVEGRAPQGEDRPVLRVDFP